MRCVLVFALAAFLAASEDGYQTFDPLGILGVRMAPPGLPAQHRNHTPPDLGVEIVRIHPDTPAAAMGLQEQDLIISINGGPITMMQDVRQEIGFAGVGGDVTIEYLRDGIRQIAEGTVGAWPDDIPVVPLDDAAEQAFRTWQAQRRQRLEQGVSGLAQRLNDLEQRRTQRSGDLLADEQVAVLQRLPGFRLRLRVVENPPLGGPPADHAVAWDARILIGTTPPLVH